VNKYTKRNAATAAVSQIIFASQILAQPSAKATHKPMLTSPSTNRTGSHISRFTHASRIAIAIDIAVAAWPNARKSPRKKAIRNAGARHKGSIKDQNAPARVGAPCASSVWSAFPPPRSGL
jgi:hypothetical protein